MVPDEFGSGMKLVRVSSVYTVPVFIRYRYLYISSCVEFIQSKFKMATWNRNLPDNLIQNQSQMREKRTLAGLMNRWTFFQKSSQRTKQRKRQRVSTGIILGKNTIESWKRLSSVIPITKLHQNLHTAKIKACSQRIGLLQKSKE